MSHFEERLRVKSLGLSEYTGTWRAMQQFTDARGPVTADEVWLTEHAPVYTQGQAGKPEHLLDPGTIPVVQTDRGGQVTYHGPGQLVVYPLLDLRRLGLGVRSVVTALESSCVQLLATYGIEAYARSDAPGCYVDGRKIASLGLRVRRGCCYHGLALNCAMDLSPFRGINPCGYNDLTITQIADCTSPPPIDRLGQEFVAILVDHLKAMTRSDARGVAPMPLAEGAP